VLPVNYLSIDGPRRLAEEFKAAFMKDFRSYIRYPAWLVGDLVSTPLWFFFFAVGVTLFAPTTQTSEYHGFSFFFFGFIFIVLFSTTIWGVGQSVRNEQMAGTLEQFFLAPANRLTLIIGRWARIFLTDLLVVGYTTMLLYLFGGGPLPLYEPAHFTFALGLFEVASIGFGLLFAGLTMKLKSYNTLSNLVFFGYMILTGALFPVTVIPMPYRYVSLAIPFTYFIDLMRHAALLTPTIFPENLEYMSAVIVAFAMLLVASVTFNWIERDARARGSIATN